MNASNTALGLNEDELKKIAAGAEPESRGKPMADMEAALERLLNEFACGIASLIPEPVNGAGATDTPNHQENGEHRNTGKR